MTERAHLRVAPHVTRPQVGWCAGKDCQQRCESPKLRAVLERDCEVVDLKCVGLCDGPVIVAHLDSAKPVVYSKLRAKKHRALLIGLIIGDGRARQGLAGRRVTKKKVTAAVARQVKRRRHDTRSAA